MDVEPDQYVASVPAGFEELAVEEIRERLRPVSITPRRGKIIFAADASWPALTGLRSVFRLFALVTTRDDLPLDDGGLSYLRRLPGRVDWDRPLELWRRRSGVTADPPRFRVTVVRSGEQSWGSPDAASALGAGVQRVFNWPVDLNEPDLDIFAQISDHDLLLGLTLTAESLHHRDPIRRGRTGLKGPIAHGLVRLADLRPGHVVVDPMCGAATIPIEARRVQPDARVIAGDCHADELARARSNIDRAGVEVELHRWDARELPLETGSVDRIICDLPFGRRVGSPVRNRHLYPPVLRETARVLRPGGLAVLLTLERRLMQRRLERDPHLRLTRTGRVHFGGLVPSYYVLKRV